MALTRRELLFGWPALAGGATGPGFRFTNSTRAAGIEFVHNTGAFGAKYLPETMGSGCAFLDFDNDGWMDILIVNGMDWPGHKRRRTSLKLYHNNRDGTFTDVTARAGLDVELYGMGVAVGDYDNDGFIDIFLTCVGENKLFRNLGDGRFADVTRAAGLGGRSSFSSSALWFDYDGDGLLDLFVCNYVRWTPEIDIRCTIDGKQKSYCTPEAYRGETCWLFRNRGDGTFDDVTVKAGVFDTTCKSLGVVMLDYDGDGRMDLFVANDTQPNKLYRNLGGGRFRESAVAAGVAFSEDGKARAGMGTDAADYTRSGFPSIAVTNFNNEMLGLFRNHGNGHFEDVAPSSEVGRITRGSLGFGCLFFDADLDGWLDLLVVNGHIDDVQAVMRGGMTQEQTPHLLWNLRGQGFRDIAAEMDRDFSASAVARGAAYGDYDLDGDHDLLITENGGPARLFRCDQKSGQRSIRLELAGTRSNRSAIGAKVRVETPDGVQSRVVKSGSSYLSQSELPLTFGLGREDRVRRVVIEWPSGRVEDFANLAAGGRYRIIEGKGIAARTPLARPSS